MNHDRDAERFCHLLSAVLKEHRELAGLSLNRLGSDAGISQQMVSYMEKGKRTPTVGTLYRVCQVLGVSVASTVAEAERRARQAP